MKLLRTASPDAWLEAVMGDFDRFLQDHASAEKKASGMAINLISHYPDRRELVAAMTDLAIEELSHYREVIRLLHQRGLHPGADQRDAYVAALRQTIRKGPDVYLLDQLLLGGIIEARGAERFGLIAEALPEGTLRQFYRAITRSEGRHHELFFDLARRYFPAPVVAERLDELLDAEAGICAALPPRAALH